MRFAPIVAAFVLAASAAADTISVATWNLGGFHQIPQSKLDKIIEGLKILDADVYVLSELNPLTHAATIAAALSEPSDECYKAEAPDQPRAAQEIGFVFRCGVDLTNAGILAGSDLGSGLGIDRSRIAGGCKLPCVPSAEIRPTNVIGCARNRGVMGWYSRPSSECSH